MIVVEQLLPYDKNRKKVVLSKDGEVEIVLLYSGEARKLHLEEQKAMEEIDYAELMTNLVNRGKERCLYLIGRKDYTYMELERKLKESFYPEEVRKRVLCFLEEYHFIDDQNYTDKYLRQELKHKSIRMIQQELKRKGISPDLIQNRMEELNCFDQDTDTEQETLNRLAKKRCRSLPEKDSKEYQKHLRYFCQKGYPIEKIRIALSKVELEEEIEL